MTLFTGIIHTNDYNVKYQIMPEYFQIDNNFIYYAQG